MAKSDKGSERGIDPDADYGTQFLNAKKGEPPPPPPSAAATAAPPPVEEKEGGAGKVIMIVVAVVAVLGGVLGFVAFAGGGDSDGGDDDLITAGGVEIRDTDRPARTTTTTEKPRPTTTKPPETTTTTAAPTTLPPTTPPPIVTTLPVVTVPGGLPVVTTVPGQIPPPVTAPPASTGPVCPGGSVGTEITGALVRLVGDEWKVEVDGRTVNNTTASINLGLTVPVTYKPAASGEKTDDVRPAQFGQSIRPGATLTWTIDLLISDSTTQPTPGAPSGNWSWTDPALASCDTSPFG